MTLSTSLRRGALVVAAAGLLTACGLSGDDKMMLQQASADASEAKKTSEMALQAAEEAKSASMAAQEAAMSAQEANERAERMFMKSLGK